MGLDPPTFLIANVPNVLFLVNFDIPVAGKDGNIVTTQCDGSLEPGTSFVAQTVKSLPTMRETWVRSLGPEDPLEKEMATHSTILAWKIPWTREPGRLQSIGLQ